MTGIFRTDLEPVVIEAEARILKIIHETVPSAKLRRIGPLDFGAPSWSCWVCTATDLERDRLEKDSGLLERLRSVADFPPSSFTFQSQETVDRDFKQNWFYAMR